MPTRSHRSIPHHLRPPPRLHLLLGASPAGTAPNPALSTSGIQIYPRPLLGARTPDPQFWGSGLHMLWGDEERGLPARVCPFHPAPPGKAPGPQTPFPGLCWSAGAAVEGRALLPPPESLHPTRCLGHQRPQRAMPVSGHSCGSFPPLAEDFTR